jgi:hypothetical protein
MSFSMAVARRLLPTCEESDCDTGRSAYAAVWRWSMDFSFKSSGTVTEDVVMKTSGNLFGGK